MDDTLKDVYSEMKVKKHNPTSDKDLLKAVKTNIVSHTNMAKYSHIDQLIKNDACIIFYDHTAGSVGHWCCMTKRGNLIEYFDSYGRKPSIERYTHGDPPYLDNLLKNSGYVVTYNPYNFQGKGTSTCGRHVVTRILFKDYPLSYYKDFMNGINEDDLVSFITLNI